ncbi:MAG: hypothetical protein SGCHY_005430 [Lobulomycetales sp.]
MQKATHTSRACALALLLLAGTAQAITHTGDESYGAFGGYRAGLFKRSDEDTDAWFGRSNYPVELGGFRGIGGRFGPSLNYFPFGSPWGGMYWQQEEEVPLEKRGMPEDEAAFLGKREDSDAWYGRGFGYGGFVPQYGWGHGFGGFRRGGMFYQKEGEEGHEEVPLEKRSMPEDEAAFLGKREDSDAWYGRGFGHGGFYPRYGMGYGLGYGGFGRGMFYQKEGEEHNNTQA